MGAAVRLNHLTQKWVIHHTFVRTELGVPPTQV